MSALRPPRVATWLLNRLAPGEGNDALTGDLVEEYQRRRSRAWYWKQVLLAIALNAGRDIRRHKLLVVRALVVGFSALSVFSWLLTRLAVDVLATEMPPGWFTYDQNSPRGVELVAALLMCVSTFASGWIVARLHRAHTAALLVYVVSFVCYGVVLLASVPQRIPSHSYAYNLSAWVVVITMYSACVVAGAVSASGTSSHQTG